MYILQELISGFDQEAAAVVMARQVSFKMETEVIYYAFLSEILRRSISNSHVSDSICCSMRLPVAVQFLK